MSTIDAAEYRRRMKERAHPFIGHEGVGSRISAEKKHNILILKESRFSQLVVVFGLLLFGPGLTAVMIAKRHDAEFVKTPWPILLFIALFSAIGWIAGTKYLFRMAAGRRIEVDANQGIVSLYAGGRRVERQVARVEIAGFDIVRTWYHADSNWVENFTLRVKCRDADTIELCTSDSRSDIGSMKALIEEMIP
jgi:hypothetical protein